MCSLALTLLLTAMIQLPGAEDPAFQIAWERDLEAAVQKSAEHRRPIFLAVNMDGESASERIVREEYRDLEFVALTRRAVCLVASAFRHSPRDFDDDGHRIPCPRLGRVTCGEHMALEPILFDRFLGGDRIAPRHALVTPEGRKLFDLFLLYDLRDIDETLARELGPWEGEWANQKPTGSGVSSESAFETWRRIAARTSELPVAEKLISMAVEFGLEERAVLALEMMVRDVASVPPSTSLNEAKCLALAALDTDGSRTQTLLLASRMLDRDPIDGGRGLPSLRRRMGLEMTSRLEAATADLAFDSDHLLRIAAQIRHSGRSDPKRSTAPKDESDLLDALNRGLDDLSSGDPAAAERVGRISLDLARQKINIGGEGGHLFLADAEGFLDRAIEANPKDASLRVARAEAAYLHSRFADQERLAIEAMELLPRIQTVSALQSADLTDGPATEDLWHEAARWLGDASARLIAARAGGDPVEEAVAIARGGRALLIAAASARADETDWVSAATFLGAVGLKQAEAAWLDEGILRFPGSNALRQAMNGALWRAGRPELSARHAERVVALTPKDGDSGPSLWYLGYARLLAAEQLRRAERPDAAIRMYQLSGVAFDACAEKREDFKASCSWYRAFGWQSIGFAHLLAERQRDAAAALTEAIRTDPTIAGSRDGLARETVDLVDAILEWRGRGPSRVDSRRWLRDLEDADPKNPFWALAVADSELREGIRAEGRGDMDAFDRYMVQSIHASRRAREIEENEDTRRQFVQSSTVFAEGLLVRQQVPRARELIYFAAKTMGMDLPGHSAGEEEVTAIAEQLRERLGERRPIDRPGR